MRKWLLKMWHRLTLGRTARDVAAPALFAPPPGSLAAVALELEGTAQRVVPAGVRVDVCRRIDTSMPFGVVRIVLETRG